jgi:hypothetical protein
MPRSADFHENHDFDNLMRSIDSEIEWTKGRAVRLAEMKKHAKVNRRQMSAEGWALVGSEFVSEITHRSNVHPQTVVRSTAMLAAHAAARWVETQKEES